MKKCLYLDFVQTKGHMKINEKIVKCLSEISELTVFVNENYFNKEIKELEKITFWGHSEFKGEKEGSIKGRYHYLKLMVKAKNLKKNQYDIAIVSTYEIITFALYKYFLKNSKNICIIENNNIDELSNPIKLFLYKTFMKEVKHIVLSPFIKEYLVNELSVPENLVYVMPHPLTYFGKVNFNCIENNLFIALSGSNDESFIERIIELEQNEHYFEKNKIVFFVKSNYRKYENDYLNVFNHYLERSQYDTLMKKAKCVVVPLPNTFKYRISGVLIDALANGKLVLGSNVPVVNEYKNRYPKQCYIYEENENFIEKLEDILNESNDRQKDDFLKFQSDHANVKFSSSLEEIIYGKS